MILEIDVETHDVQIFTQFFDNTFNHKNEHVLGTNIVEIWVNVSKFWLGQFPSYQEPLEHCKFSL